MPLKLIISNQVIFCPSVLSAALSCDVNCSDARRRSHIRGPLPPLPPQGNCCPATVTPDTLTGVSKQS